MLNSIPRTILVLLLFCASAPQARAQWAVVDAPAIVQLVAQVKAMKDALQTAHDQLTQTRTALATMTGNRGMEQLLAGISRNYLPANWSELSIATQAGASSILASAVRDAISANAILSPQRLAAMPDVARLQITAGRRSKALQQALAQSSLANVSERFESIQSLIAAIPMAVDQKGILDLQARIGAELGMLQNEQTKQLVLQQSTQAQEAVRRQQEREYVIAGHGDFDSRFQPAP